MLKGSLSGSNIINHKSQGTTLWKINVVKKELLRKVLPGYPVERKFKTPQEVHDYFSGDKIECLLCGRFMKSLGNHLRLHGYTVDEYKEKYGLPYNRGLCADSSREKRSETQKNLYLSGVNALCSKDTRMKGCDLAKKHFLFNNRRTQPWERVRMKETHKYSSNSKPRTTLSDICRVEKRHDTEGRSYRSVCLDNDMPNYSAFYAAKKRLCV